MNSSLEDVDLNLLLLLHWLISERSVTRAGLRVGLSQPAASRSLKKLRAIFRDELLVKSGRTLEPTKLAIELEPKLKAAILNMRSVLATNLVFEPATLEGSMTIACNDYLASIASRVWVDSIAPSCPNMGINWRPLELGTLQNVISGGVDFIMAPYAARGSFPKNAILDDMVVKPFLNDEFVIFGLKSHPVFKPRNLRTSTFVKFPQILVSPAGYGHGIVDSKLHELGLSRKIQHRTWSFLHAAELALSTDCITVIPLRLAQTQPQGSFRTLPFKSPKLPSFIAWHSSRTKELSHKWVRRCFMDQHSLSQYIP